MKERKKFRANRVKKGIFLLPNLITTASLFCGFYAVIAAINKNFLPAAVAILIACLFDGFDGKIARLTRTATKFGREYDSLSDLVSFGIAPGLLIFLWTLQPFGRFGWLASFLFVACSSLRLARFNAQPGEVENKYFKGLPTTGAGFFVASLVLVFYRLGYGQSPSHVIILIAIYSLSFLMVSNVKYGHMGNFQLLKRKPFSFLVGGILVLIVIAAEPQIMLFVISTVYVLHGPFMELMFFKNRRLKKSILEQEI